MSDKKIGLSSSEALERYQKDGPNVINIEKKKNYFLVFLAQFKDLMIIILLIATVASFVVAILTGIKHNWDFNADNGTLKIELAQPFIILFVIVVNSLIGTVQEIKSDQAVKSLNKLNLTKTKVYRDNKLVNVESTQIVVGDVIMLEAGDVIPADCKIIESSNLYSNQSILTGESLPVKKYQYDNDDEANLPTIERNDHLFSGASITNGHALCEVIGIGTNTEIGKISSLVNKQKKQLSPLQIKLEKLSKVFGYSGIVLFIIAFIIQIILNGVGNIESTWPAALAAAISLAVAAVPEGLSTFVSIILALGVKNIAKQKAIVKKLSSIETLGSAAIICSDKTGTITKNQMTVVGLWTKDSEGVKQLTDEHKKLLINSILCSTAKINFDEHNKMVEVGDPTETALIRFGLENQFYQAKDYAHYQIKVHPFDSVKKMMSVQIFDENKNTGILIVKGALESLLKISNNQNHDQFINQTKLYADQSYRTLVVGTKPINKLYDDFLEIENDLELQGIIALIDPPRKEVIHSVNSAKTAGIKPIMITGDDLNTAKAIAKQVNIYNEKTDLAISSKELNEIDDETLKRDIEKYSVYARMSPKDKMRIIDAWQANHQVVAMTGDGVNDAPALKKADIGCAMGITGTDVAKETADMIIVDDNFATIINSVESGRRIYQTIKKVIQNLLISSVAELLVFIIGLIVMVPIYRHIISTNAEIATKLALINQSTAELFAKFSLLSAAQLLWINILTHGFPAIALGIQKSKNDVMNVRPYYKYENLFARRMGIDLLWQSCFIALMSLAAYSIGINYAIYSDQIEIFKSFNKIGSSMGFIVLGIAASIHCLNLMSDRPIFLSSIRYYWLIYLSALFSVSLILLVALTGPIASVFRMDEQFVNRPDLVGISLGMGLGIIPAMEIFKLFINFRTHHRSVINEFKMITK
ncbi:cation-translocating P-type ATPase [Mycoplasmoides gallisepticum]|uniref:cation-translocating P-type ATPase n=1 Tax=Mycoplasmoides gallisepticum TaxID=2096 RepID=UPI0002778EA1|nr:cation-transporting P-type ATPase [Mycoplasmoides gallisepticum]AFP78149.1 cation-transporting P-type ATPase [Mycoplasmoides gallisepticum NY01_2001.047-5-1P]